MVDYACLFLLMFQKYYFQNLLGIILIFLFLFRLSLYACYNSFVSGLVGDRFGVTTGEESPDSRVQGVERKLEQVIAS